MRAVDAPQLLLLPLLPTELLLTQIPDAAGETTGVRSSTGTTAAEGLSLDHGVLRLVHLVQHLQHRGDNRLETRTRGAAVLPVAHPGRANQRLPGGTRLLGQASMLGLPPPSPYLVRPQPPPIHKAVQELVDLEAVRLPRPDGQRDEGVRCHHPLLRTNPQTRKHEDSGLRAQG